MPNSKPTRRAAASKAAAVADAVAPAASTRGKVDAVEESTALRPSGRLNRPPRAPRKKAGSIGVRELSAQATREAILLAAIDVFAKDGFAGGRVDKISRAANSHDRMIYYYFESKEGLFVAVLEEIYRRMNVAEEELELDPAEPIESLKRIIRFVCGYYRDNPAFVTLLNTENLHGGRHIAKSPRASEFSSRAIELLEGVLASGVAQGLFRSEAAPRDIYLMIVSMGYFPMSNRHTLKSFLGQALDTPAAAAHWEGFVIDTVMRVITPTASPHS